MLNLQIFDKDGKMKEFTEVKIVFDGTKLSIAEYILDFQHSVDDNKSYARLIFHEEDRIYLLSLLRQIKGKMTKDLRKKGSKTFFERLRNR